MLIINKLTSGKIITVEYFLNNDDDKKVLTQLIGGIICADLSSDIMSETLVIDQFAILKVHHSRTDKRLYFESENFETRLISEAVSVLKSKIEDVITDHNEHELNTLLPDI